MLTCCYVLSRDEKTKYSEILSDCKCVEGDRAELVKQIEENKDFCRDKGIDYEYFCGTLKQYTVIYIKNDSNTILGACSLDLGEYISIRGICVPHYKEGTMKGIGTLLLNNVKHIGELIGSKHIYGLLNSSAPSEFYTKNGFEKLTTFNEDEYDIDIDVNDNEHFVMTYKFKKGGTKKGGTKKRKSRNNKSKKRPRKIAKNRKNYF
jgi:hypothetical protein